MLTLPPKFAQGLRNANLRPVVHAEFITGVLDKLLSLYHDVTTVGEDAASNGYVLAQHRTQVKNEDTGNVAPPAGTNPFAMTQLLYPAQAGDPTQAITAVDVSAAAGDTEVRALGRQTFTHGVFNAFAFQSFRFAFPEQDLFRLTSITLRLRRLNIPFFNHYSFAVRVANAVPNEGDKSFVGRTLTVQSAAVSTSTLTTAWQDITFAFPAGTDLYSSQVYSIELVPTTPIAGLAPTILWQGYINRGLALGEVAGTGVLYGEWDASPGMRIDRVPGLDLFHKVQIAAYSYDGATPNYREYKIDLGETPILPGYIDLDYRTPADARVRFRLWSSATGAFAGEETALGSTDAHTQAADRHDGAVAHVHDGDAITVLTRYYKLREELLGTSNTGQVTQSLFHTPSVHGRNLVFPKRVYSFASAPILGAVPAIMEIPSLPRTLDPKAYIAQTRSGSVDLADLGGLATRMATEEHLPNALVRFRIGLLDPEPTSLADLAPYGVFKVTDYSHSRDLLRIKYKDRSADLERKIPQRRNTATEKPVPIKFTRAPFVEALDHLLFNEVRARRRYRHAASFAALAAYLGTRWTTSRTIADPTAASELLAQMMEVLGAFLTVDEEGAYRLIRFPRSEAAGDTWTAADFIEDPEQIESFTETLINRCTVWWGYESDGEQSGSSEFVDAVTVSDLGSQAEYAPGAEDHVAAREIKAKWLGKSQDNGQANATETARRVVAHGSKAPLKFKTKTSLAKWATQEGDMLNLATDVYVRKGKRGAVKAPEKCMVLSKTPHFGDGTIDWTFIEAKDPNAPPAMVTPHDPFTLSVTAGTAPFNVTANATGKWADPDGDAIVEYAWDFDYNGIFQRDAVGINPTWNYGSGTVGRKTIALQVTDARGGIGTATRTIRALAAPTAVIGVLQESDPGRPMLVTLIDGGSTSPSGRIVKREWDLSYVASEGFNADVTADQAVINMPHAEITVGYRVTDDDSLVSPIAERTFTGKELAPPAPTNFQARQVEDYIQVQWNPNPDIDPAGSELQIKAGSSAVWDVGTTVVDEHIPGTTWEFLAPKPYGTYTLMLKFKDTTGNYSAAATSALLTTIDPQKRNVVVTRDEKALGWPGVKMNLIYEIAGDRWWLDETGRTIQDLPDTGTIQSDLPDTDPAQLWGTTVASGTYEQPFIDLLAVLQSRLWVVVPTTTLGDPAATTVTIEARLADTDTAGVPDWGAYSTANLGDIVARYVQIKVTVACPGGAANRAIENVQTSVDVPDIRDGGRAVTIPIGGLTITFNKTFHAIPGVNSITIHNMTTPLFYELVSVTLTALTVKIRRASDNADVGGLIDWSVDGY